MINLKRYSQEDLATWNQFVDESKNKHFFFSRKFMDYHKDRFSDHSFMIFDENEKLVALLPANERDGVLYSHQGLTFGGLIVKPRVRQVTILAIFEAIIEQLKQAGFSKFVYKPMPYIYRFVPSEEDLYSLVKLGASLTRRDVSSTVLLESQIKYGKGRKWSIKKAIKEGVEISTVTDISTFWEKLGGVLMEGHGKEPTHNEEEIRSLSEAFPENIKFYAAYRDNVLLSGAVVFENQNVAHTQYLFSTQEGRKYCSLDYLIHVLIDEKYSNKKFFDFGISTENEGLNLNEGLIAQKEGYGARAVCHDFYEVKI